MNAPSPSEACFSIAAVERDTGLAKDTLRVWERRYGFPTPERDEQGDRVYALDQVERLRLMARLMALGHRPGKLMAMDDAAMEALLVAGETPVRRRSAPVAEDLEIQPLLAGHRLLDLRRWLEQARERDGCGALALRLLAITESLRARFRRGELSGFELDLFGAEVLRALTSDFGHVGSPRVVLASGDADAGHWELRLLQAIVTSAGADCLLLPDARRPVGELMRFVAGQPVDALCLAFASETPRARMAAYVADLVPALPPGLPVWLTLAGSLPPPRLEPLISLAASELVQAIAGLRA